MSSELTGSFMQALHPERLKTAAARRFAEFCVQDFPTHAEEAGFDPDTYAEAVGWVVTRLEMNRRTEAV